MSREPGPDAVLEPPATSHTHPPCASRTSRGDQVWPPDLDPGWVVEFDGDDPRLRRVHETLLTVADGRFGTRGTPEEGGPGYEPFVMAAGIYTDQQTEIPCPLPGPLWFRVELDLPGTSPSRRLLDLRSGILYRETTGPLPLRSLRFACLTRPGTLITRTYAALDVDDGDPTTVPGVAADQIERSTTDGVTVVRVAGQGGITAAITTIRDRPAGPPHLLDRIAVLRADPNELPPREVVSDRLDTACRLGVEQLEHEHRAAWATRWRDAQVSIGGDPDLERAVRFGLFHLMASVADEDEAPVGARGLSGPAYAGHVFWDTDVFVLPFLAATHPSAARAMIDYRLRRLEAAQTRARRDGRAGARFPWESAHDGSEATPPTVQTLDGSTARVRTGELEEHIVADVAWAAWHYAQWTGNREFLAGPGRTLLVETARYWASRIELDPGGSGHVGGVIGPDEYHEDVDDNAYTNIMARWNLRRAAELAGHRRDLVDEAARWRDLADTLVDGHDPQTGWYEQFDGFFGLEPLQIAELVEPPVAADVLLGTERVAATQVIKQADVLMLHHLVPDEVAPGSLVANLDRYLPFTAHGSSLSPGIHASLLARAGRPEDALAWLRMAARLDLDDRTGTTAGGLHLATMGSVWQALAFGFLGLRPHPTALHLDPQTLPAAWQDLEVRVRFHGHRVVISHQHAHVDIHSDGPVPVVIPGTRLQRVAAPVRLRRHPHGWDVEGMT